MNVTSCKSAKCAARILWVETENGKRMPLDAEPSADGSYRVNDAEARVPLAFYVKPSERSFHAGALRTSHWSTCISREEFRKKQA